MNSTAETAGRVRALVYGWIAAKLMGRPGRSLPEFFAHEFRIDVSEDTLERTVAALRGKSDYKSAPGPTPGRPAGLPRLEPAIWTDWLRLDEERLGLRKVLIRIPNDGLSLAGAFDALEAMPGIRQIIETKEDREILAVALLRPGEEDDDLRARIQEHLPDRAVRVHVILRESDEPTKATWLEIARRESNFLRD
jgi:hypothetical protein